MSYMLAHLFNGWQVDQAILSEEDRVVVSQIYLVVYCLQIQFIILLYHNIHYVVRRLFVLVTIGTLLV